MLIDTHAHIDFKDYENLNVILHNAKEAGIKKIIIPGVEPTSFERIINLTQTYTGIYAALGIHPSEARLWNSDVEQIIRTLITDKKVVAIGEIGLDYYWDRTFIEQQKSVFIKQIELANEYQKPIIIHDRDAHKDTFDILNDYAKTNVIMHCFSGSVEFAKECVKKGYFISIGGVATFKNAKTIKNVIQEINLENLLLDTDSPFLTPEPYRGKRNEPAFIKYVAEEIAKIKNISIETVSEVTTNNALKIFNLNRIGDNLDA